MSTILRIALAALLAFSSFGIADAQYGGLPQGSYRQSCQNIRLNGNTLSAGCTAPNGQLLRSSVNANCRGDIANMNGYLTCKGGGPGFGPGPGMGGGVPQGSYLQSCRNVRMHPGRLSASCTAPNGQFVHSSLPLGACRRGADIANINGRLQCIYR